MNERMLPLAGSILHRHNMDVSDDGEGSLEVGTTGTIGSLMTRELESMKHSEQASSSARRRQQTGPVFVPCGAAPGKASRRRNQADGCGSSGSSIGQGHCGEERSGLHCGSCRSEVQQPDEQPPQEAQLLQALRIHLLVLGHAQLLPTLFSAGINSMCNTLEKGKLPRGWETLTICTATEEDRYKIYETRIGGHQPSWICRITVAVDRKLSKIDHISPLASYARIPGQQRLIEVLRLSHEVSSNHVISCIQMAPFQIQQLQVAKPRH
ncbi:unnamed protein product [Musa banksii]